MLLPFAERFASSVWKWWAESFLPALGGAYFIFGPGQWTSCSEAGVLSSHIFCYIPLETLCGKACKFTWRFELQIAFICFTWYTLVQMAVGCLVRSHRAHIWILGSSPHLRWKQTLVLWSTEMEFVPYCGAPEISWKIPVCWYFHTSNCIHWDFKFEVNVFRSLLTSASFTVHSEQQSSK